MKHYFTIIIKKTTTEKVSTSIVFSRSGLNFSVCAVSGSCCRQHGWCGYSSDQRGVGCSL